MRDLTRLDGIHYAAMSGTDEQDDNFELPVFEDCYGGVYLAVPKIIVGIDNPIKTRSYEEIVEALTEIYHVTWYIRHLKDRQLVEQGELLVVDGHASSDYEISREDWDCHLQNALEIKSEYGLEDFNPQCDYDLENEFRLGMLLGKLSILRWVMGAEMDTLQT